LLDSLLQERICGIREYSACMVQSLVKLKV